MTNAWKNFSLTTNTLNNKIILITGAGSGIGRALAMAFARSGATIILMGRTVEKLESVYDEIEADGCPTPAILPIDFETANDNDYKNIHDAINNEFGRLDGLINNAAELGERTSINGYSLKVWERLMQVNVTAPFALTKYCLPLLQKSEAGSILFTSSSVGLKGKAYWGAYAASKAAIENMMQTLADELEDTSSIRVNSINPGATRTTMRGNAYPAEDPNTVKPADTLAPLYGYFMADESQSISGQQINYSL